MRSMYRRPKFLETLHEIREEMSREADYDMDLFAEMARSGGTSGKGEFITGSKHGSEIEKVKVDHRHLTTDN